MNLHFHILSVIKLKAPPILISIREHCLKVHTGGHWAVASSLPLLLRACFTALLPCLQVGLELRTPLAVVSWKTLRTSLLVLSVLVLRVVELSFIIWVIVLSNEVLTIPFITYLYHLLLGYQNLRGYSPRSRRGGRLLS